MMKEHEHDLAFLDGGEGVYCMDADCDFRLTDENLLSVLKNVCRRSLSYSGNYKVELMQEELNSIWRAKLILDNPDDWHPQTIRTARMKLEQLVDKIREGKND